MNHATRPSDLLARPLTAPLVGLLAACAPAAAQEGFALRFDHSTVLVRDLEAAAASYLRFLTERGVAYTDLPGRSSEPQVRPDGVRQVNLQDPDGNWIEINDAAHPPL